MGSTYFAYNATTTVPGFDSRFHRLISLYGAKDYCVVNSLNERSSFINAELLIMEQEFMVAISSRDSDQKATLIGKREDFGQRGLIS